MLTDYRVLTIYGYNITKFIKKKASLPEEKQDDFIKQLKEHCGNEINCFNTNRRQDEDDEWWLGYVVLNTKEYEFITHKELLDIVQNVKLNEKLINAMEILFDELGALPKFYSIFTNIIIY